MRQHNLRNSYVGFLQTILTLCFFGFFVMGQLYAQQPRRSFPVNNNGRLYGKIVDENGKGVSYASVQLWVAKFDTVKKAREEKLITGQLTTDNGDFSLEGLPTRGNFTMKVSVLGYAKLEKKVGFGSGKGRQGGGRPSGGRPGSGGWSGGGFGGNTDKDLGNIALTSEAVTVDEVVIEGEAASVTLALDRKIYRVDKDAMAVGGTAEDALRNVPSLSVDLDGNLTLRNASPQLFVDGRPTTLTLDQIASDAIEKVEVITNPSAKYDASGGQAGIVNIVLKKDRRIGYNGSIRLGGDTRRGYNSGGNINLREGKINVFASAFLNRRVSVGEGETDRYNLLENPQTNVFQDNENTFIGSFASIRGGVDWFVDNRNTLTFSGSYTRGDFEPENTIRIRTDSLFQGYTNFSESVRTSLSNRNFKNTGGSVLYKYLFPKEGKELTADVNFNRVQVGGSGDFTTEFITSDIVSQERQSYDSKTSFVTIQTDFVDPITKNIKLEAGLRAALRTFDNNNSNLIFNQNEGDYVRIPNFADVYQFDDHVYAAYGTFNHQFKRWGYMLGLRVESSRYTGVLPESGTTFENEYPFSLFPSAFFTYKLNDKDNLQASYTRRINRPNFFQLLPFTDFSDSLNLRRGNPNLIPEFTNSLEVVYQKIMKKGNDFLVSAYYKQASDLITAYQFNEYFEDLDRDFLISSYTNSNSSLAYGVEFTMRNTFWKNVELTSNLNMYNSRVDASNIEQGLINEQFTWNLKEVLVIKLPEGFRLQVSGEYRSRAAFTPSSGNSRFRGWRGITNTAQGYTIPNWFLDMALRKDLFKRKVNLTVSVRDIFKTRRTGTYNESNFFIQESWRIRNPQLVSVNLSYRFGKPDASLFKRKNNRVNTSGSDMMQ